MLLLSPWVCLTALLLAVAIDVLLGEPRRVHPLALFGKWVTFVERRFWVEGPAAGVRGVLAAVCVIVAVLLPGLGLQLGLSAHPLLQALLAAVVLYGCIGLHSLYEHADAVAQALRREDLPLARERAAGMVSRDTESMEEAAITTAVCESVLENGNDAVFGAIVWFLVGGIPGVLLYRATNTLDAMWGYKNARYRRFGWAAARLDDLLNWIPARWVALSYALTGHFSAALRCWSQQAGQWDSPNAGPVMAAGAGSLQIRLGGGAWYGGQYHQRPPLGCGDPPRAGDIARALALVSRSLILWLVIIAGLALSLS